MAGTPYLMRSQKLDQQARTVGCFRGRCLPHRGGRAGAAGWRFIAALPADSGRQRSTAHRRQRRSRYWYRAWLRPGAGVPDHLGWWTIRPTAKRMRPLLADNAPQLELYALALNNKRCTPAGHPIKGIYSFALGPDQS